MLQCFCVCVYVCVCVFGGGIVLENITEPSTCPFPNKHLLPTKNHISSKTINVCEYKKNLILFSMVLNSSSREAFLHWSLLLILLHLEVKYSSSAMRNQRHIWGKCSHSCTASQYTSFTYTFVSKMLSQNQECFKKSPSTGRYILKSCHFYFNKPICLSITEE